jgi:hypothetical protein
VGRRGAQGRAGGLWCFATGEAGGWGVAASPPGGRKIKRKEEKKKRRKEEKKKKRRRDTGPVRTKKSRQVRRLGGF